MKLTACGQRAAASCNAPTVAATAAVVRKIAKAAALHQAEKLKKAGQQLTRAGEDYHRCGSTAELVDPRAS
jgi:hypothetical protein